MAPTGLHRALKLAFLTDRHNTVGIDCVAMCVNDIVCCGAKPLFFLDYLAVGKNVPERVAEIVSGVAEGCVQAGCAIIGGEQTAEMPGFYEAEEYDMAGFAVGIVDKPKIFDKNTIVEGDVIIGLPSTGLHSNGFSLVRKVFDVENQDLSAPVEELGGASLGETLLTPTRIYVKPMLALMEAVQIKSASHITGGGFYEVPRALPPGMTAKIKEADVPVLPIFELIQSEGAVPRRDMFNTFNMGIGMAVVVAQADADLALNPQTLREAGESPCRLGEVVRGPEGVILVKARIAVLVSGGGTNLQALLDAQVAGALRSGEVVLVVSDQPVPTPSNARAPWAWRRRC